MARRCFLPIGAAVADVKGRCPQDNELRYPVSAGALANAYGRARACFARQIEAGKVWNDVR